MQNKELNTSKQDIYYFLHIRLPTTPRLFQPGLFVFLFISRPFFSTPLTLPSTSTLAGLYNHLFQSLPAFSRLLSLLPLLFSAPFPACISAAF